MQSDKVKEHSHGCGGIAAERNRYYTGKFMTARDFENEQQYVLSRRRLHNRLLHGWGIVCGLRVLRHPNAECAERWVVVRAGIALDCCGRELVLNKDTPFELPLPQMPGAEGEGLPAKEGPGQAAYEQKEPDKHAPESPGHTGPYLLCLEYSEKPVEYVPALYAEGECDPTRQEANRVREVARIALHRLEDLEAGCWKKPEGGMDAKCRDDCDDDLPGPSGSCIDADCPCGGCVPLALIRFESQYSGTFEIDMLGRRELAPQADYLTHVTGINWPHGGEVTLHHVRRNMGGRLEIRFDRKILPVDGHRTGISPYTFVVEYGGVQKDIEYLPFDREHPPYLQDDCMAVFTIDPEAITPGRDEDDIAGNTVYVTLKCDFILDCHGNPVDGNHLKGRLPSGSGTAGGVFESWFRVVSGYANERERAEDETPAQPQKPKRRV